MSSGLDVSGYYDSLLSKLIVWDLDRAGAVQRMLRALDEMRVVGVSTTIPFAAFAMKNAKFRNGELSTAFVEEEFSHEIREREFAQVEQQHLRRFAAAAKHREQKLLRNRFVGS